MFEHQEEAVAATLTELVVADRCKVLMACATGKTRIGVEVAVALNARTVVVYLPSLALLRQMLPDWINAPFEGGMSYLCVCSDKTVAQGDEAVVTAEELIAELHLGNKTVTTKDADVNDFLTLPGFAGVRVLFSTYQSSDVVRGGCPDGFKFELGIFDEAHRTTGKDSAFSAPLLDSHTPIAKRVFMTATPKHFDFRKRNKDGEARAVFSMDDESIYGRAAFRLPIRRAIERGLIAGYQILVSVVNDRMIAESLNQKHVKYEVNEAELLAHALAIRNAMDTYGIKKIVTFHDSVAEAKLFAENPAIQEELGAELFHVNGFIPTRERSRIMDQFAAAPEGLVTNARCLTEGVDVPAIDMVAFLHPRKSHVDIIQAIGRALRLPMDGTKDTGYILLPLYVSDSENGGLEAALEQYGYDTIWQVIQALREQDEVVEAALRDAMMKGKGEKQKLDFIHVMGRKVDLPWLREAISTRCIEALGESWDGSFGILERLHSEGKNVNVATKAVIDGKRIGGWVSHQRRDYKAGKLSSERIARLEAIGFELEPLSAKWEQEFTLLEQLHREGKDIDVGVGAWGTNQRRDYRTGELSAERIARLEAIGFEWESWGGRWIKAFAVLQQLYNEGKDVNVGQGTCIQNKKIGAWASQQRDKYKTGKLSAERSARLEAIGFEWELLSGKWSETFAVLQQLYNEGKDVNVVGDTFIDGKKVGVWVKTQRMNYLAGSLSKERITRLESIGFKWIVLDWEAKWLTIFAILQQLHSDGKDVNVSSNAIIDDMQIGFWIRNQRENYKHGRLSKERIAQLESIGFKWNLLTGRWEKNFAILQQLKSEGLNVNVPEYTIINGQKIGTWISAQRQSYKDGSLSKVRITRLESIGIKWIVLDLETQWLKTFAILHKLHSDGKDVNVSSNAIFDGVKVGSWVSTQRQNYKDGSLSKERIVQLESIGFKWNLFKGKWEENFAILQQLKSDGVDVNVPEYTIINRIKIGAWIYYQRNKYNNGKLSVEQITLLESVGLKWH